MAINTKGKRKITVDGEVFYWFVRIEKNGSHRIHIISENKKFNEMYPMIDTEVAVTPSDIREIIVKSKGNKVFKFLVSELMRGDIYGRI